MRSIRPAALVCGALLVPALAASPASAAAKTCSRKATVTAGTVVDLTRTTADAEGNPVLSTTPVSKLTGASRYVATGAATIKAGAVTYKLTKEAIFGLSCFGHSRAQGARYPAVILERGTATWTTARRKPGAIISTEGLWDPYAEVALDAKVTRTPSGDPSLDRILREGPGVLRFGTAKVSRTTRKGYLNITPYVGRKSGLCRQGKGGTFTSTRFDSRGYAKGTSKFVGLASFSPR